METEKLGRKFVYRVKERNDKLHMFHKNLNIFQEQIVTSANFDGSGSSSYLAPAELFARKEIFSLSPFWTWKFSRWFSSLEAKLELQVERWFLQFTQGACNAINWWFWIWLSIKSSAFIKIRFRISPCRERIELCNIFFRLPELRMTSPSSAVFTCVDYVLIQIRSGISLSLSMLLYERSVKEKLTPMAHTGTDSRETKLWGAESSLIVGPRVETCLDGKLPW